VKARGVRTLRAANETRLGGLLALNRRLGYQPLYREIVLPRSRSRLVSYGVAVVKKSVRAVRLVAVVRLDEERNECIADARQAS
jgi:hypothetical protein